MNFKFGDGTHDRELENRLSVVIKGNFTFIRNDFIILLKVLNSQRPDSRSKKNYTLQPVEQKPHSQKDRQDEKAEGYVPDERTR